MDNKKVGMILICISLILMIILGFIRAGIIKSYQKEIDYYTSIGEDCPSDPELCPHEQKSRAQIPIFIAGALLLGIVSLGIYMVFFEKSQRAIISTLEKEKQKQTEEEKFSILLKGLNDDEKKVIRAVREQDGITQQTLRLRVDIHKSKLSIVLGGLEKKGLIKRVEKGKTKQIFLRMAL